VWRAVSGASSTQDRVDSEITYLQLCTVLEAELFSLSVIFRGTVCTNSTVLASSGLTVVTVVGKFQNSSSNPAKSLRAARPPLLSKGEPVTTMNIDFDTHVPDRRSNGPHESAPTRSFSQRSFCSNVQFFYDYSVLVSAFASWDYYSRSS